MVKFRQLLVVVFVFSGWTNIYVASEITTEYPTTTPMQSPFEEHEIVPDVIDRIPEGILSVQYDSGVSVEQGNELTPKSVKDVPVVSWDADSSKYYTLIMTDPDATSRAKPTYREALHWLVTNIPGGNITGGDEHAAYFGSGPSKGTGLHRYVIFVYEQPGKQTFDEAKLATTDLLPRMNFSTSKFAIKYNFGSSIAANFFQAAWDEYVPILHDQLRLG